MTSYHDEIVYENGCSSYHDPNLDENLSTISYSSYGQPVANTNTSSTIIADTTAADTSNQTNQNVSQLTPADLNQAEQQMQSHANQTSSTSDSSDLLMKEKLLNYTNDAILALNDDNETAIQQNLVQIQNILIKAIGKPVVIIPAPAIDLDSD
ncbi:hypothetical protein BH23THE1_BH23THE1_18450 [soil metagenome]